MSQIVLVHGAWHGGWCWNQVAGRLRALGHDVHAPTLTGLCERIHLATPAVCLTTHIDDILNHIRFNELDGIVLVGHSYGGAVITGVASALGSRIRALVYLDAFNIESSGTALFDHSPDWRVQELTEAAEAYNGWQIPCDMLIPFWSSRPAEREMLKKLTTPSPMGCFTEKVTLTGAEKSIADRTYLICEEYRPSPFWPFYERYSKDPVWRTARLPSMHDAMITIPDRVTHEIDLIASR
ncbi:alpha/beta fold hydrolase [Microbaculum marinum]|uniref:Alpha/beta fold hydrolase n=1 Tax=Microbaculum marinum TaxID=1764581 RepID=A0AAW9RWS1_9HYPH